MAMIYKASPMGEIADIDEKMGIVKGYGSYFGNKDSDGDVIAKGAYQKTIKENGERVRYLWQHKMDKPIGKIKEMYEDDKGLMFVAEIPKTTLGNDALELMKAGIVTENSVGILPIQEQMKDGFREITEVKLYEISAVTLAANDQAKILDVKGKVDIENEFKRFDALAKLIRKGKISDEMGYAIEAEILKLKSFFIDFTKPNDEFTLPKKDDAMEVFSYLSNKLTN
jgi:HK97 family phage prohead protease